MTRNGSPAGPTTLVDLLRSRAEAQGDRRAYTFLGETGERGAESAVLTWAGLDERARAIAAALQERGLAGERALLLYPPGIEFVAAFFGCLYAGVVAVPSYPPRPNRDQPRLRAIPRDARPRVALADSAIAARSDLLTERIPELAGAGWLATDALDAGLAAAWRDPGVASGTVAFLQYTSGSTATPKGVIVSHGNLLHNEEMIRRAFGQSESSVIVGWLPLYHDMGLIGNVLQPLYLGAPCYLMSPVAFLQQPLRWLEAISRYRATTSGGPNFAYELCVRRTTPEQRAGLDLSSWTAAFNGAEPVRAETLERFAEAFAPAGFRHEAFYPCYGLAEATLFVSGGEPGALPVVREVDAAALERHRAEPAAEGAPPATRRSLVGCGHGWMDQRVVVADPETGEALPADRVGEVWVAGPSVAQGYWGRDEETERTFRARLAGTGEGPFLRTGDLGFYDSEGTLFLTGRIKDLIILRGRNLYPQDIERTAEVSHPALRPGNAAAFAADVDGEERLVVVHEVERGWKGMPEAVEEVAEAVRRAVAEEHEAAVHQVVLLRPGSLPKTSSGKVQRHAARAAWQAGELEAVGASAVAAPAAFEEVPEESFLDRAVLLDLAEGERTRALAPYLRRLAARAARVQPAAVPWDRPLTVLGLDSLAAVELKHAVEADLGVPVSLARLLEGASLEEIAGEVLQGLGEERGGMRTAAHPAAVFPLSYGQRSLRFLERLAPPGATFWTLAGAARVHGDFAPAAFRHALEAVADRHPALRTTFHVERGEPVQRVHPGLPPEFVEGDGTGLGEAALRERLEAEIFRPFDLETGPLLRAGVFRLDDGHALFLAVHHLVSDLWSIAVLVRELEAFYREAAGGAPAVLAPLPVTYADYVDDQRDLLEGPRGEALWDYWRDQLGGDLPVLDLPADRPRPPVQTYRGASRRLVLDPALSGRIRSLAREREATLYVTLLAGFEALLHRYSGQDEILLGTPTAGRTAPELAGLIGYFVSPVVLRADFGGEPGFAELVARTRRTALAAFEHQDFPFALLAERLQTRRDPSRSPLFQAFFVLEQSQLPGAPGLGAYALGKGGVRLDFAGLGLESFPLEPRSSQFDLMLLAAESPDGLVLALDHNPDLFDAATIDRMLAHLRELLGGALDRPELPVGDLPWLTAAERAEILGKGSVLPGSVAAGPCLHQLFEAQAERTPEATAVVLELDELSYGELNRRANRLAHHLRSRGVGPEVRVCLALERSPEQIVAILAVLKAGGAYVPLDPAYPAERLSWLLEDAGRGQSDLLLVSRRAVLSSLPEGLLPAGLGVVDLDADRDAIAARSAENPDSGVTPVNLAYIIYTSGSTGRPKGVLIEHARVVRLFTATEPWFGFGAEDVWTMFHSYAFDFSVWEIWGALAYGGRLVIVPRSMAKSPEAFHELLADEGVTVLSQTPSAFRQLLHADEDDAVPLALRVVVFGGEALDPAMLGGWLERHGEESPRLINMYGITETTVHVTYRPIGKADTGGPSAVGQPIPDLQVYLLDRRMQPVPAGVPGEIFVGGAGLARGYLHRPDLTAERFVPDPFAGRPGERLYKSGDLARRRPGSGPMGLIDLEYLGRIDHQVKVRGFRIELGEIEAALGSHPAVREAVVLAQAEPAGTRLVAYLVPRGAAPAPADLRQDLGEKLPDYMVPWAFVFLPALPLTATGKVNRRALPVLGQEQAEEEGPALPRNPTEETLAAIWRDLLGVETVGIHDDFFELGGHSLLETRLVSRIRDRFGVELTLAQVFSAPTVAGLAAAIDVAGGALSAAAPIPRAPRDRPVPLSFGQERLWFLDQLEGRSPAYAVPAAVRLRGRLDRAAFAAALDAVAARHEALRTSLPAKDGKPVQAVASALDLAPPEIDLRGLPAAARDDEARRLAADEGIAPFDLARGPLVRTRLLTLDSEEHLLLLTLHHAISDGWSLGVLVQELAAFYLPEEGRPRLPELPIQYADYAVWQRRRVDSGELDGQLAYWKERLAGAPPRLDLPLDRPRPAVQTFRGRRFHRRLPRELAVRLEALAHRQDATLFMVLFGAFAALLHRLAGPEDLVIGTPIANRNRSELEPLIGFFVNTLALRADLSGDPAFADLVARLRPAVLGAYDHQDLPFERLVAELRPERNLAETPLFQVLFVLQNNALPALRLPGLELAPLDPDNGTAKFDLTFEMAVNEEGILLSVEHSTDLFDNTRMERWAGAFHRVLEAVAESPERPVSALPLLSESEAHQLRVEWNDTDLAFPEGACLHELFQAQAARTPEARALRFEGESLTYRELADRAAGLAAWLRRAGVGPDVPVGLCAERGVEMMVAVLGILEAGGAYLPLDPSHPRERLERIAGDAEIPVLLLGDGVPEDLAAGLESAVGTVLRLGGEVPGPDAAPESRPVPSNLAYILYTSGSTGQPKGVQITHRAVVSFLTAVRGLLRPSPGEGMIAETTLSFDISVVELFLPLVTGGWVELVSRDVAADGARLGAALAAAGVQRMQATPAGWRILLDAGWEGDRNLVAISGGEALDPDLADRLLARTGALWNIYGPTEATIWSAVQEVRAGRPPRVGRPIGNNRVYLLDRRLSLLPLGSAGELGIGGVGLARGYRGRPDLTAERFLPDPFSESPGGRLYRTGDLIRWTAEGELDFLGRIDFQVKIRGFRIELGEIEAALAAHPGIAQAVVTAREDRPGDRRLVAYFVPRPGEAVSLTDLRDFLASRLPSYMVPAAFVPLEAFPLSPNGKVDRRALPSPEGAGLRSGGEYVAPATPVEEELARLWAAALGVERVGTADNFFELGGHSLLATQLLARYRESFGVELSLRDLFKAATVAELARLVETAKEQKGTAPATPTIARVSRDRYRVTPGQAGKKSSVR